MDTKNPHQQLEYWIRSQHLICRGTDFIFETVDQSLIERFEQCLLSLGGEIITIREVGAWPMGPKRTFKILRASARVPRPAAHAIVSYWANNGSTKTRFSEISE
nr:CpeR family transcriptional regulator [Synechococcus sp. CBW1006]